MNPRQMTRIQRSTKIRHKKQLHKNKSERILIFLVKRLAEMTKKTFGYKCKGKNLTKPIIGSMYLKNEISNIITKQVNTSIR